METNDVIYEVALANLGVGKLELGFDIEPGTYVLKNVLCLGCDKVKFNVLAYNGEPKADHKFYVLSKF